MKTRFLCLTVLTLAVTPLAASAQATTPTTTEARREQMQQRRDAMRARREQRQAMTPEQREALRATRQERIAAMPPEQQQYLRDLRTYQQSLREKARTLGADVQSGTLTRDAMAAELKAFRDANRPARPAGARAGRGTP
jgi:hypothetical protein